MRTKNEFKLVLILFLALFLSSCEKLTEYDRGFYLYNDNGLVYLEENNGLYIQWSENATAEQQEVIRNIVSNLVCVEGGAFKMGAQPDTPNGVNYDEAASDDESPVHNVTLSGFLIGKYEVTQREWEIVVGTRPEWTDTYGLGDSYPVYNVKYNDVLSFIAKLNELAGLDFRLPTEAEWEFAARGGNQSGQNLYSGSNLPQDVAWYKDNACYTSHEVGTKFANELGLYDMSGNVCEWCADYYGAYSAMGETNPAGPATGTDRVVRGGSFCYLVSHSRCSARDHFNADGRSIGIGFRLALSE